MSAYRPAEDRFWAKVAKSTPGACWEWTASLTSTGYGQFNDGSRIRTAHRFAYELVVGPVPDGLVLDHLCRNATCINPAHLEPVTQRENIMRSPTAPPALNARKTHCKHGHELDGANLRIRERPNRLPERVCRTCTGWTRAAA